MDLLEDFNFSLLNFNFVMIHIIHKILVIKNKLNHLKDSMCFLRSITDFFLKKFFHNIS